MQSKNHHGKGNQKWACFPLIAHLYNVAIWLFSELGVSSHNIVGTELSLLNVSDGEVLGDLLRSLCPNADRLTSDGAYDSRDCYVEIAAKVL
ncbi:hypothetical protein [Pseudoalteromonas luteoviolacea]|uniref:hypothetical protein n=1 Tax=Pseudoalteromonas luteoviolacea TaxID=43657 RepID=UPI00068E5BAD|nr:hypothetical protein [Pseudoalteromonas luteoviolacea]